MHTRIRFIAANFDSPGSYTSRSRYLGVHIDGQDYMHSAIYTMSEYTGKFQNIFNSFDWRPK